jgi:hypothetical protein
VNDNGKSESIVVRCGDHEMMILYGNLGVTLVHGERDQDGMLIANSKDELPFDDNPELKELYSNHAWDGPSLLALIEKACLEMPES